MKAVHFERLPNDSYLVRVGPEDWKYGDPYDVSLVMTDLDGETCEIKGLDKAISISDWRAIRDALLARGFKNAVFDRKKDGQTISKKITPELNAQAWSV